MKGVEAPFQLVVSAIAIVFILILSYQVLQSATREDCIKKVTVDLKNIATTISTAVYASPPTKLVETYDFRCLGGRITLDVKNETDETMCNRICGYSTPAGCVYLVLKNDEEAVTYVCVEGATPHHNITVNSISPFGKVTVERHEGGITITGG